MRVGLNISCTSNKFVDFVGSGENSDQENGLINSRRFDGRDGLKLPISFPYSLEKSYAKFHLNPS
jgi:hypothetical protein